MKHIFLDVETKQTFDEVGGFFPEKLGVSFVGVELRDGFSGPVTQKSFFEEDLPDLFPILEKADVVVGFNIDGFDMPTLVEYYPGDISQIPTLDLMGRIKDSVGHRIGLNDVAQETLGIGKTGDGLDAIKYYRTGQKDKLRDYCLQDVKVTRELYDYGIQKGLVKFRNKWNRLIVCEVNFNFTPEQENGVQMSLI